MPIVFKRSATLLIAGLYMLAAARAIVPGLCQTQRAVGERLECGSCCDGPAAEGNAPSFRGPAKAPCAFCFLSATPNRPLDVWELEPAVARLEASPPSRVSQRDLPQSPLPWLGRSPPRALFA